MKRKILSKVFTMLLACLLIASSISLNVFALEETDVTTVSDDDFKYYNTNVSVSGSGSTYNNISNYYNGGSLYTVNSDGTATLEYDLTYVTGYISFKSVNCDSNVYYYRVSETDEWVEASMTWGSSRANAVSFDLENSDINNLLIKAEVYNRSSGALITTIEGSVSFEVLSQLETTVSMDATETVFKDSSTIILSANPSTASIYYTINGVESLYTGPIEISESTSISAYATLLGYANSEVVTGTFIKSLADGFGAYNTEYEPGEYAVSISAKTEGSSNASSYADFINENATLVVDENNNGFLQLELLKGVMTKVWDFVGYVEDYTYYDENGNEVAMEVLEYFDEESFINTGTYPPKVVQFPLINKRSYVFEIRAQSAMVSDNSIMPTYTSYHDFDIWVLDFNDGSNLDDLLPEDLPEVEDTGFKFGSDEVELSAGKYVIDASFYKANDHSELSMSNDAVYGDYILEVKNDGSATVSLNFGGMEYGGIYSYVDAFRYYTSDTINSHYLVDATVNSLTTEGTPNNVTVNVTNKALDGMYVNFDVLYIHTGLDAYLSLDYSSATPYTSESVSYFFGSDEVELNPGKYLVNAEFLKSNNHDELSMSNDAVYGDYILEVKNDGSATISLNFGGMEYGGINSYVETFRYYTSDNVNSNYLVDATVNSYTSANTPNNVTVNVTNKALDGMYVNFDVLYIHTGLDAYLSLDYSSAILYEEQVVDFELENSVYVKELGGNLVIRVLCDFYSFVELQINNIVVPTNYYSIKEGSIIVEISEEYLSTLDAGTHSVSVLTTNGVSTVSIDIVDADESVATNDISDLYLYSNLLVFSLFTMLILNEDKFNLFKKQ